ncbi:hypothetical protein HYT45_00355 [Candidatus Uhrbacteria bacterium]|nr:hypothetical protein [Candidatus Uhrbacteria bacterium]
MPFYILGAVGMIVVSWLLTGFAARCLLKNFVYEIRKRYGGQSDPPPKELWRRYAGREQWRIILKGYFGLVEVEDILKGAAKKNDNEGNLLTWEDKFKL